MEQPALEEDVPDCGRGWNEKSFNPLQDSGILPSHLFSRLKIPSLDLSFPDFMSLSHGDEPGLNSPSVHCLHSAQVLSGISFNIIFFPLLYFWGELFVEMEWICQRPDFLTPLFSGSVQDGDLKFSLESVKKLKELMDGNRHINPRMMVPMASYSPCQEKHLPEELRPVCKREDAPMIFRRLSMLFIFCSFHFYHNFQP